MTQKLILDLDTGIDDALAISYALGSLEVDLIGIVGTYGNVLLQQGIRNDLAITDLLGHPEVKVYQGLPHALKKDSFEVQPVSAFIHGQNGIGETVIPDSDREPENESGIDFIIDAVKTYGKDLVYVPTGPQTNRAAAIRKAPEIIGQIGKVVLTSIEHLLRARVHCTCKRAHVAHRASHVVLQRVLSALDLLVQDLARILVKAVERAASCQDARKQEQLGKHEHDHRHENSRCNRAPLRVLACLGTHR